MGEAIGAVVERMSVVLAEVFGVDRRAPFDCEVCGGHVASGERVNGTRTCSTACDYELWDSHQM